MANNGYISSSGINQIFTTGPYSGSIVTSSYSNGSVLEGPTISFYQAFISGSDSPTGSIDYDPLAVNLIAPCSTPFYRYYIDPINCPIGGCIAPTLLSVEPVDCLNYNFNYNVIFNSGSTAANYSTIEYSTISDFSFNTGSLIVTNSIGYTNPISISNLEYPPFKGTVVYFRVFNSCSISEISSYSNIISASCNEIPPPAITPFTVKLKNIIGGTLFYTYNSIEYSLLNNNTASLNITDLNPLNFSFRTLLTEGITYTIIASGSSAAFNGYVSTDLADSTLDPYGNFVYQSINDYQSNLYFNSDGTPDASITVDRSLWDGDGTLELSFTTFSPSPEVDPWYSEEIGGGGEPIELIF